VSRAVATAAACLCAAFLAACQGDAPAPEVSAALRLGSVLGADDAAGYRRADAPRRFRFPADHGTHPDFRSEWWYLTVMLADAEGREFGVQFTLFRQALTPPQARTGSGPWRLDEVYLGHLALTDVGGRRHREAERLSRPHPAQAGVRAEPFRAWVDGWTLTEVAADPWTLHLDAGTPDFAVDLRLTAVKPVVLQGEAGLSRKGPAQASYYYSLPRLAVTGALTVAGREHAVDGGAWFDREWSTSVLGDEQHGWDWFALQFDDGTELMAFQLRRRDGRRDPFDQGLRVAADGRAESLDADDFELEALASWRDDSGTAWPVRWRLTVGGRDLEIRALLDDQRMDTSIRYWEGLVGVYEGDPRGDRRGDQPEGRRIGRGYLEMTGYGAGDETQGRQAHE